MNEYQKILAEINSYFEIDDIEMTSDYISAYDLYNILLEKLEPLREVVSNEKFQNEINKEQTIIKKIGRILHINDKNINSECTGIYSDTKNKKSQISIFFKGDINKTIHIYKDFYNDEIYFGKQNNDKLKTNKDFVTNYYEYITHSFNILEEYSNILQLDINNSDNISQVFSDSFINITLTYNSRGNVKIIISLDNSVNIDNIYNREWFNLKTLSEIVDERKIELLKKIPIKISELDQVCQNIIIPYIEQNKKLKKIKNI